MFYFLSVGLCLLTLLIDSMSTAWGYIAVDINLNFTEASDYCESNFNSTLAIINNANENQAVRDAALAIGISEEQRIYIGLNDRAQEGVYVWPNGQVATYLNWHNNEPNDRFNDKTEDCTQMLATVRNNRWNDAPCWRVIPFVCNDPPTPRYIGVDTPMSYEDAEDYCQDTYGTSLGTIESDEDNELFREAAEEAGAFGELLWTGLNDLNDDSQFEWNDGSALIYQNFYDFGGISFPPGPAKKCIAVNSDRNDQWVPRICQTDFYFVCNAPDQE